MEQFNQILEKDIAHLEQELRSGSQPRAAESLPGKEAVKQSLKAMTGTTPAVPSSAPAASSDEDALLPNYVKAAPAEVKLQVEQLLETAVQKGIVAAAEEAKNGDPYVLDAFHDALVEKLYPELQKRGIVK